MIWVLWIAVYTINNGMITWLPTLYTQVFDVPLQTSLLYGWTTSAFGVAASVACALLIDKVGRKRWYTVAFLLAVVPLVTLALLGATSAIQILVGATIAYAILQTVAFSLYLYSAELYPTRLRAIGTGFGSAWLRAGSSIGPVLVGFIVAGVGIQYVFVLFAVVAVIGGLTHQVLRHRNQGKGPGGTLTLTRPATTQHPRPARRAPLGGRDHHPRPWPGQPVDPSPVNQHRNPDPRSAALTPPSGPSPPPQRRRPHATLSSHRRPEGERRTPCTSVYSPPST